MIYTVYAAADTQTTTCEVEADTPQAVLRIVRTLVAQGSSALAFDDGAEVNEIYVSDPSGDAVAIWRGEGLRLNLAAASLLSAARHVLANWEQGDLAAAVRELSIAVAAADEELLLPQVIAAAPRQREWLLSLAEFVGLAILPVCTFRPGRITLNDVCTPEEAEGWSVWGTIPAGGRQRLEDFATRAEADAFAELLRRAYPHLAAEPTRWEACVACLGRQPGWRWPDVLSTFDGIEVNPCHNVGTETGVEVIEQCEPEEADFWSAYGHYRTGGLDCLEDFATEAEAEAFAADLCRAFPHLAER